MQVKQISPDIDVQNLDDDELLMAHTALHSFYREFQIDEEVEDVDRAIEDWDKDSVVQTHEEVQEEMEERDIPHQELSDLDDTEVEQSDVSSWASEFVQSDDPETFVQSNPPEMDWYLDAIDEVEQIDGSIDLREYVTLSATQVDDLDADEHPVEWLSAVCSGVVGYTLDEDTNTGVVLSKQEDEFSIVLDDEEVYQSEKGDVAYSYYDELSVHVEQGSSTEEAANDVFGTDEEPDDDPEIVRQGRVIEGQDVPEFQWYVWEQQEAENWLMMQGFEPGDPEQEGEFLSYEIEDSAQFETLNNEWRGPWMPPETFVEGFDARPVLLTVGKVSEEETEGRLQAAKFQVEEPPELPQQSFDGEIDWYWYKFEEKEARQWLSEQDVAAGEAERHGPFLTFEVEEADRYDSLETVWEGSREPTDTLAGGEKPRRVTYGVDEEEREIQSVEFLTQDTVEQKALQYVEDNNVELE